jgi:putative ABC transport system permease protein
VRLSDLIALSLSALAQHKLRTALTALGVTFASFILVASVAARYGAEEVITREYSRFHELRQIEVHPGQPDPRTAADEPPVPGVMSEERRQRLRTEMVRRRQQRERPEPSVRLTRDRLRELAALDHVVAVRPVILQYGRVFLGDRAEHTATLGVPADHEAVNTYLVAGSPLSGDDAREAVVHEYLLYQLGAVNEADVPSYLGKQLRLEYKGGAHKPGLLLTLLGAGGAKLTPAEEKVLEKVVKALPDALSRLRLEPAERDAALALLKRRPSQPAPAEFTVGATLTIRGVIQPPGLKEVQRRGGWVYRSADVFLPLRTAEGLFERLPQGQKQGYDTVVVEVDSMDHVKEVHQQIKDLGLTAFSAVEWLEREQFVYLLIFSSMTVISLIALVVAALGMTNTMVMSVLERVREIGIMKAVGARDGHILTLFLVEGLLLGLGGGALGVLLSRAAALPADAWVRSLVSQRLHIEMQSSLFTFPTWLLLGTPLFAAGVTTLAALYPARRAVRVNPVEALRHE